MQLVAVPFALADVAQRGEVRVSHVRAGLSHGLELHEDVVVQCADGEFLAGRVVGFEFELEDTLYLMELGVRLPVDDVAQRLGGERDAAPEVDRPITTADVMDLLSDLRRGRSEDDAPT